MKKRLTLLGLGTVACGACFLLLILPTLAGIAASGFVAGLICQSGLIAAVAAAVLIAIVLHRQLRACAMACSVEGICGCGLSPEPRP
ncbi:hypothetical protein [Gloeobacter kilaueensis]|uniref:Uncharacterized protein n=1 Tax=Gloeobacter kilaueensis (strain ATCC BAA-2537 / CCAP 1431/1 / ULC 316 / JS1) TaxID=1183438 RepID=U5QJW1_GLOK1|nr:hypothetical protein [Gloeobacter kilaueensis]AGY57945.1 hypothetical protein GKIL_1699 [Gloeobacter kilaueensis JS1]